MILLKDKPKHLECMHQALQLYMLIFRLLQAQLSILLQLPLHHLRLEPCSLDFCLDFLEMETA